MSTFEGNDFMLVIRTPNQKSYKMFGSSTVCIDDTHGTNTYHISLIILLLVEGFGEGCPVLVFVQSI